MQERTIQEINMLDSIERYIRGEMLPEERVFFEQLRKSNPQVDQMVVEHTIFLNQMNKFGERKNFKSQLLHVHDQLFEKGIIKEPSQAKIISIWKKYKRVVAVAACIAGITAVGISGLVAYFSPKTNNPEIAQLKKEISRVKNTVIDQGVVINNLKSSSTPPISRGKFGGTGFLVDGTGYIATSAHVVSKADSVYVVNNKGEYFKTSIVYSNDTTDVAIIKIIDSNFIYRSVPYSIKKSSADVGEEIFTLGFPRNEIVYGKGYLSAHTGYNGDTTSYQIAISANPGNSGGPIFNPSGEVIGILSGKQTTAEGVVFSSKSINIYKALDQIRKDTSLNASIKLSTSSAVKDLNRVDQLRKIEDCIFIVKSY
jgi:S1-C subfamily serine protease